MQTLEQVELRLKFQSFLGGVLPTKVDFDHQSLSDKADAKKHPHTKRWAATLALYSEEDKKHLLGLNAEEHKWQLTEEDLKVKKEEKKGGDKKGDKKKGGDKKKEEKKDDDEEIDLFGDDDEEVEAPVRKKKEEKPVKKKKVEKTFCQLDIKPYDTEFDLTSLIPRIKKDIQIQGLVWGEKHELKPVAFGIKKLVISCVYEDEHCESDNLVDKIQELYEDDVQSCDVAQIQKHC